MSDETANPETGAVEVDAAVDPIAYLTMKTEAPQEGRADEAEEPETPEAAADDAETTGEEPETDAEQAEPDEAEEEPRYRVKVNGEEIEVTLSELQAGYQKDADYRQKTAKLGEERKSLDARKAEIEAAQQQLETLKLQALAAAGEEPEPDWVKLAAEDPIGTFEAKAKWDARQKQRAEAQQQLQQRYEAQRREIATREWEALLSKVPEWRDPVKADAASRELAAAASEHYGIPQQEFASNLDHRLLLMLKDAAAYRALQKAKPAVEKKIAAAPKVQTPGSPRTRSEDAAVKRRALTENLRRNPNSKEAAIAYLLGGQ